jgi:hypothetical protein
MRTGRQLARPSRPIRCWPTSPLRICRSAGGPSRTSPVAPPRCPSSSSDGRSRRASPQRRRHPDWHATFVPQPSPLDDIGPSTTPQPQDDDAVVADAAEHGRAQRAPACCRPGRRPGTDRGGTSQPSSSTSRPSPNSPRQRRAEHCRRTQHGSRPRPGPDPRPLPARASEFWSGPTARAARSVRGPRPARQAAAG